MIRPLPLRSATPHQSGVALVVALIFLVILTLLGIAAFGNNALQTRMAFGIGEANVAFQSTETALSAGENWLALQGVQPLPDCSSNCAGSPSIWNRPSTNPPVTKDQLLSETWWTANGRMYGFTSLDGAASSYDSTQAFTTDADSPRYVVEYLGVDPTSSLKVGVPTYRIYDFQVTARGFGSQGATGPTRTITQSVYGKGF